MGKILKNALLDNRITNILINDERIEYIGDRTKISEEIIDLDGKTVIPGLIDPHVHVRDLNQAALEDWLSVSRAALKGGVTTIFDMPNTQPPTNSENSLKLKREAASKAMIDYKFYLGATDNNLPELEKILSQHPDDVCGIKVFLASSSANETFNDLNKLTELFKIALKYDLIVAVHTELQDCLNRWQKEYPQEIINHSKIRNRQCAIEGTKKVLEIASSVGNNIYLTHVSTKEEIELIRVYKNSCRVICEVTPHHLFLDESILSDIGNLGKVNPPLRTIEDNIALWNAIDDGLVDLIGSDHAPHLISDKKKDYSIAPSGFPGLETTLLMLIRAVESNKISMNKMIKLTSHNPADIFKLEGKGEIKEGYMADITVLDLGGVTRIDPKNFRSKAKYSPFEGFKVNCSIEMTIKSGEIKFRREE